jgi:hypothetical protein
MLNLFGGVFLALPMFCQKNTCQLLDSIDAASFAINAKISPQRAYKLAEQKRTQLMTSLDEFDKQFHGYPFPFLYYAITSEGCFLCRPEVGGPSNPIGLEDI